MYANGYFAPNLPGMGVALDSWALAVNQKTSFHRKITTPYQPRQNNPELIDSNENSPKNNRPSTAGFLRLRTTPKPKQPEVTSQSFDQEDILQSIPRVSTDRKRPQSAGPLSRSSNRSTPSSPNVPIGNFFNPISPSTVQNHQTFLPQFVQMDRLVCRFYGYFSQPRLWDFQEIKAKPVEANIIRKLNIYYYLEDNNVELYEVKLPNNGFTGGLFFKRGLLKNSNGTPVTLMDLAVGQTLRVLGQSIQITDADSFTREYFRKELSVVLPPPVDMPEDMREDLGAQFATGLCPASSVTVPRPTTHGNCSPDFPIFRQAIEKSWRFLNYDGCVLRFQAIDLSNLDKNEERRILSELNFLRSSLSDPSSTLPGPPLCLSIEVPPNLPKFALSYFLSDSSLEIRAIKNKESSVGMDDDSAHLLLKKTKLTKNWRQVRAHGPTSAHTIEPEYIEPPDLRCGGVLDVYGRLFLLLKCDEFTLSMYREMGLSQSEVAVAVRALTRIEQPIPELGDNNLAIGSPEDTLLTVYGAKRPSHANTGHKKVVQNLNRMLRCKIVMCTQNRINASRIFFLTYFLQDDSIQIFEEVVRNSGVVGGTFLKRGRYNNDLTATEGGRPRYFKPQDIYLGNTISVNGVTMRITELDSMSIKFCESIPGDFPMFDPFEITRTFFARCPRLSLRSREAFLAFSRSSNSQGGLVDEPTLTSLFNALSLSSYLNQQEIHTLTRALDLSKGSGEPSHSISLFVDLLSQVNSLLPRRSSTSEPRDAYHHLCRQANTLWRRDLLEHPSTGTCSVPSTGLSLQAIPFSSLLTVLRKHAVHLNTAQKRLLLSTYEVRRSLPPSTSSDTPLSFQPSGQNPTDGVKVRADLKSKSRLQASLVPSPSIPPVKGTKARPPLPGPPLDKLPGSSQDEGEAGLVDVHRLCDDIYIADWD